MNTTKSLKLLIIAQLLLYPLAANAILVEKAQILENILEKESSESFLRHLNDNVNSRSSISNIIRYGEETDEYKHIQNNIKELLGETAIRHFSVEELKVLQALAESGGEKYAFAIRILVLVCLTDSAFMQELNNLSQSLSRSGPPPFTPRPPLH